VAILDDKLISYIRWQPELAQKLRKALPAVGFETADWQRVVMYRRCFEFITQLNPSTLDVMEISAGPQWVREFNFRSFTDMKYPEYDICAQTLDRQFDLIIADQIFEHLKWPYRAGRNVFAMLNLAAISSSRHHSLSAYTGCRSIAADGLKTEYPISFKNAGFRPLKLRRAPGATAPA
jgi:hypothetical protein